MRYMYLENQPPDFNQAWIDEKLTMTQFSRSLLDINSQYFGVSLNIFSKRKKQATYLGPEIFTGQGLIPLLLSQHLLYHIKMYLYLLNTYAPLFFIYMSYLVYDDKMCWSSFIYLPTG